MSDECNTYIHLKLVIITRDSEVIIFSPLVFLYGCMSMFVGRFNYEGLVPHSILQVNFWGCLVVQVMLHAPMTLLMTSKGHKVGQILKLICLCQYLS